MIFTVANKQAVMSLQWYEKHCDYMCITETTRGSSVYDLSARMAHS